MLVKGQLNSLKDIILKKCSEYNGNIAFLEKHRNVKKFEEITYGKMQKDVIALSTALSIKYNLLNQKIAVIGENSYNWYMSYMAITTGTGIVVPLDKELPENEILNLMNRSRAKCIIYSNKKANVVKKIKDNLPSDTVYINMDKDNLSENELYLKNIIEEGQKLIDDGENWYYTQYIDPNEFRILMFTSGTTSTSKGVMLCHRNIISNLDGATEILKIGTSDRFFSVLPMHHVYEIIVTCMYGIANGSSIAICSGLKYISQEIKEAKPTVLVGVPLLMDHICKKITKVLKDTKKEKLVNILIRITNGLDRVGIKLKKKVFAKIQESLGGRLKYILVSAAPVEKSLIDQIEGYGYVVFQGYGLTETASVVAGNREETRKAGTVGQPCNCKVKIDSESQEIDGEILVQGNNVMIGYYEDDKSTNEVLIDGWLHTGDLGHIDKDNNLIITGRCKNMIVTNNGKKIFPEELENEINRIELVKESMVYGEGEGTDLSVSAIVTLDEENINEIYGNNRPTVNEIKEKIWNEIKKINGKMVSYKAIKNLKIRLKDFEKTTTLKIKRFLRSNRDEI